ncbi:MAG: penicillin-binding protein [Acidobacteriota bacterium]
MPETLSTRRLRWLLRLLLLWAGAVFCKLIWLQVVHHDELAKLAEQQQQKTVEIEAPRGTIFDRTGQPLAKTLPAESICINPMKIPDAGVAADLLSRVLDLKRKALYDRITLAKVRNSGFMWVKRKVSVEEADRVRSLRLDWVEFRPEMRRFYPHGELASHVLGSTGIVDPDDVVEHGNGGVEMTFDDELSGRPGLARVYNDVRQNAYDSVVSRVPEPGTNLTLTLDPNLQYDAEKALAAAVAKSNAKTGSVVVLNPYTGDILAMANYPAYDPNGAPKGVRETPGARSDLAVTTPFEPGSVFKVITLAAALETTNLTPDTMINCGNGTINLFGRVIHDHNRYSSLSMADVLANSSNIGAINIGLKVGEKNLYDYVRRFGFGRKTGIELPGESAGMLRRLSRWEATSIGSVAMGHEVGATSIQLALAGAIVANGGMRVKPRLILARQTPGGVEERTVPDKPERVIKPETAIKMRQMMEGVVLHGTGKQAILRGYTSGGKTGSAQIYDFKAKVYTHHYNASFLGFAPVSNPQVVIAVTLIGTSGGAAGYGGPVAAPVFRAVASSALRMFDVPKDLPDTRPRLAKSDKRNENDLAIAGLGSAPEELAAAPAIEIPHSLDIAHNPQRVNSAAVRSGVVSSVTGPPASGASSASAGEAPPGTSLGTSSDRRPFLSAQKGIGPIVPDLRGLTLRAVLEESAATGLPIEVQGDGMSRAQDPPPGSILAPGSRVHVQLTR